MTSHAIFTTFFFFSFFTTFFFFFFFLLIFFCFEHQIGKKKKDIHSSSYFHILIAPTNKETMMNINSPFNENNEYTPEELKIVLEIYKHQMIKYKETCIRRSVKRGRPLDFHEKMISEMQGQLQRKMAKLDRAKIVLERARECVVVESIPSTTSTVSTMASEDMFTPSPDDSPLTLKLKFPEKNKTESNSTCSVV